MKTSLVYEYGTGRLYRGRLPSEAEKLSDFDVARFEPAHDYTTKTFRSLDSMMHGAKGRHVKRHRPDAVRLGSHWLGFERGVCRKVRVVPPECVSRLEELDAQAAAIRAEIREILEDAYARGEPLRKSQIAPPGEAS
jgi:hypothetical protein